MRALLTSIAAAFALSTTAAAQIAPALTPAPSGPSTALEADLRETVTPVRSQADLDIYTHSYGDTFLDVLPADAKAEFLAGVTFNERGITSFPVDVLEDNLTASEAYRLLSYFGMQDGTAQLDGLGVDTALDRVILSRSSQSAISNSNSSMTSDSDKFLLGYSCSGPGTCAQNDGHACTSNC